MDNSEINHFTKMRKGINIFCKIIIFLWIFFAYSCNLSCVDVYEKTLYSPDKKQCLFIYSKSESVEGYIIPYIYISEKKIKNCTPEDNFLKLRYSDICPLYIQWTNNQINLAYSCHVENHLNNKAILHLVSDEEYVKLSKLRRFIMYDYEHI